MKKRNKTIQKNDDRKATLKDSLDSELLSKLQQTKKALIDQEEIRREDDKKKKEEARKLREKNKSFEELFEESSMNWKDHKG